MADAYLAGESALWVQPDGPNTKPEFLGCHQMGDLTIPLGEQTVRFVPDPVIWGKFQPAKTYQGAPGAITTSLTTYIGPTADWLGKIARRKCPFPFYAFKVRCGRRDMFDSWERGFGLNPAVMTQRLLSKLASREPSDEDMSEQTFDISSMASYEWFALSTSLKPNAETRPLLSIWGCSEPRCQGACGDAERSCDNMIVGSEHDAPDEGRVWSTADLGETWIECTGAPWPAHPTYDIMSVVCFPMDDETTRWLVASDDFDMALEVAYSDDQGVNWTRVVVGATPVMIGALGPRSLFCRDKSHIWLATQNGYIFFSSDGGETWAAQYTEGTIDFTAIWFSDDLNGMAVAHNDEVVATSDGGEFWETRAGGTGTGNHLMSVTEGAGSDTWWIGTRSGELLYSTNHGINWTRRRGFSGDGTGEIKGIRFANDLTGFMLHNGSYWGSLSPEQGTVLQTINGGYSWRLIPTEANLGLIDLVVCDENTVFVVGVTATGWDGLVLKVHE